MLTKIGFLIAIVMAALWVIRVMAKLRTSTGSNPGVNDKRDSTEKLVACPRCGAFVPGGDCDCDEPGRTS